MSRKAKALTLCGVSAVLLSGCSVPPNTDFYPVVVPKKSVSYRVNELLQDPGFRFAASDENVVEVACQTPESSGKEVSVTLSDLKVAGDFRSELFGSGDNINPKTLRQEMANKSEWVVWDGSNGDILPPGSGPWRGGSAYAFRSEDAFKSAVASAISASGKAADKEDSIIIQKDDGEWVEHKVRLVSGSVNSTKTYPYQPTPDGLTRTVNCPTYEEVSYTTAWLQSLGDPHTQKVIGVQKEDDGRYKVEMLNLGNDPFTQTFSAEDFKEFFAYSPSLDQFFFKHRSKVSMIDPKNDENLIVNIENTGRTYMVKPGEVVVVDNGDPKNPLVSIVRKEYFEASHVPTPSDLEEIND